MGERVGLRVRWGFVAVVLLVPLLAGAAPVPAAAAPSMSAYWATVRADGPLGWWRLGDACPSGLPCTLDNETGGPDGSLTAGSVGAAGLADRTDDAAQVVAATIAGVAVPRSTFSVEAWVDSTPNNHALFDLDIGDGVEVSWNSNDGAGSLAAKVNTTELSAGGGSMAGGGVHHLVVTFDGSTASLFVDGVLADSGAASAPSWSDPSIVMASDPSRDTKVDEFAVYGRALSAAEVRDHWVAGSLASSTKLWSVGKAPWTPLVGDPVDVSSGNLLHTSAVSLPAAGGAFGLGWSLAYNSLDPSGGVFGRGWSSSFDAWLTPVDGSAPADGDVVVRLGDGRLVTFVNGGSNVWVAPPELRATLAFSPVSESWSLTSPGGEVWVFDEEGWLVGLDDGQGQTVVVERDAGGVVESVENAAAGRRLVVDDSTGTVSVASEVWEESAWVADGRELTYSVTDGELVSVESADGGVERYSMVGGVLERVEVLVAGDGSSPSDWVLVVENVFDEERRVVSQETATGAVTTFEYDTPAVGQTTVTFDATPGVAGGEEVFVYSMSAAGELVGVEDPVGGSVSKGWVGGQLGSFTDRRGGEFVNVWDGEGRLVYRVWPDPVTGEVRPEVVEFATPGGAAGEAPSVAAGDVFESFTYVGAGDARVASVTRRGGASKTVYSYDGDEVVPEVVEVRDTVTDAVLERSCVISDAGLVSRTIEGADGACSSGEVVVDFFYGDDEPAGETVPDCPPRLLCVAATASGSADEALTVYSYDAAGRVATVTEAWGSVPSGGSPGATTTAYEYDAAGRVTRVFDPVAWADWAPDDEFDGSHYATDYGYDHAGRLVWVSGPDNPYVGGGGWPSVAYTYTPDGQVDTETTLVDLVSGAVTVTNRDYDGFGNVVAVTTGDNDTDPQNGSGDEATTTYGYGPLGRLQQMVDPAGVVTTFGYDADGNQVRRALNPDGGNAPLEWRTGYDAWGRVVCETDPSDEVFTSGSELDCSPSPIDVEVSATSGAFKLVVDGVVSSAIPYDVSPASLQATLQAMVPGDDITTVTAWGSSGYQITWGDGRHHQLQGVAHTLAHSSDEPGIEVNPEREFAAVYEYDAEGRVVREIGAPGEGGWGGTLVEYAYDPAGRQRTRKAQTGVAGENMISNWAYRYDIVEERSYDLAGRVESVWTPPSDVLAFVWSSGSGKIETRYDYDAAGRLASVTRAAGTADEATTTTAYDPHGWVLSTTSPEGRVTESSYDPAGRAVAVERPSGSPDDPATSGVDESRAAQLRAYSPGGQVVSETDFAFDPAVASTPTREFSYNAAGWLTSATDALGTQVLYTHDLRGNRLSRTSTQQAGAVPDCVEPFDADHCIVHTWAYNPADQEIAHTRPVSDTATTTITSSYDDFGRLAGTTQLVDVGVWSCTTRTYDDWGRLWRTRQDLVSGGDCSGSVTDTHTTEWSHDTAGRVVAAVAGVGDPDDPDGPDEVRTVEYRYDLGGRLTDLVSVHDDGSGSTTEALRWGWSINGTPRRFVHNDGATLRYGHDRLGRLVESAVFVYGVAVPLAAYEYDSDGVETREVLAQASVGIREWSLDPGSGRPVAYEQDFSGTADDRVTDLVWGPDGRLVSEATGGVCQAYDYDAAGQLVARREASGGVGTCRSAAVAESVVYDGHGNRVEHSVGSVTSTATVNRADQVVVVDADVGGVDVVYGYDLAGRRTLTDPQGSDAQTVYGWGANGQITSVVDDDGATETTSTVGYDAEGRMRDITVDTGAATVHNVLLWDPTQAVPQIVDALVEGVHHRQNYGLRRISSYGDWYSYDWQTSTVESTDYPDHPGGYSPWGQPDSDHTGFGYRGEFHIGDLIHLRNRTYDPTTGTFLSPDPLDGVDGETTVANPYHYTYNDPLNQVDPLGLRPLDDEWDIPPFDDPCYRGTGVPGLVQRGDACGTLESPEAESLYCSWQNPSHIFDCLTARNMADIAIREAASRFGSDSPPYDGGPAPYPAGGDPGAYAPPDGSRGNAFQHMVWNGLMVEKMGYDAAKGFADRHEMISLSSDPQIRSWELHLRGMDFANNYYGRELAEQLLATNAGKNFEQRLFDEAEAFVRADQACWIKNYDADRTRVDPVYFDSSRCGLS